MDERLIIAFRGLIIGQVYSTNELKTILSNNNLGGNLAALSVNRWNKGMNVRDFDSILFEYVSKGHYKYLGPNNNYCGNAYLYCNDVPFILIGTWKNGKFQFAAPKIKTFLEWKKENHPGILLSEFCNKFRILRVVDAGNGRRRLGLTQADHNENQEMIPARIAWISLDPNANCYINLSAINTYFSYGSISHGVVNRWIIDNRYEVGQEFIFKFCILDGDTHIYTKE